MIPTTDGPLEIFVDIFIFEVSKINDIELTMTFELYFDLMWEEKRFVINETSDKWGQVRQGGDTEPWTNVYTRPGLMRQDKVTCCVNRPQCLLKSTIILKPWDLDSLGQPPSESLGSEGYYNFRILGDTEMAFVTPDFSEDLCCVFSVSA